MRKFIYDRFKAPSSNFGLTLKTYRIFVKFLIDEEGKVTDIQVRAPHPVLKNQIINIIEQLPDFIPGKHNGEVVKTSYLFPIRFDVE